MQIIDTIFTKKIIAIVRDIPCGNMVKLADALKAGGINCIEVTFDQKSDAGKENTLQSIRKIKEAFGEEICLGAGTVMSAEQVELAVEAGAEYIISPNTCEEVIRKTKSLRKISIPGALTPSEAAQAYSWGADIVKLFPAGNFGPGYVKALCAPLRHIPFLAVGGINPQNCKAFIEAGAKGVGVGGNLVSPVLVREERFGEITAAAKEYIDALS